MGLELLMEIESSASTQETRIWGLGGAGFAIRAGEEVVYVDPWLVPPDPTRTNHRAYPPPFAPSEVRKAEAILSTHEHEDHCNVATLLGITKSTGARFLGPESSIRKAIAAGYPQSNALILRPGDELRISPSFTVRAFRASDPYERWALMTLITTPRGNILHSGDTAYFEGFKEIGDRYKVDVALLNFGKQIPSPEKPYYMNAEKLSLAARDLRARVVVPMHWNLWVETREDPHPIEVVLKSVSPSSRLAIVDGGERLEL
jgi:L-ascorbate 6-phosphate lactonase